MRKLIIIFSIFICLKHVSFSQTVDFYLVDTSKFYQLTNDERLLLNNSLPKIHLSKSDTTKIRLISEMYSKMNDNNVWILYLDKIKSLLDKFYKNKEKDNFYKTYLYKYYNDYSYYNNFIGNINDNLYYYLEAKKLANKLNNKKYYAEQLNNIAFYLYSKGDFKSTVSKYDSALKILDEIGDIRTSIVIHNNLGYMQYEQDEFNSAKKHYLKAIKLAYKLNDTLELSTTYHNLALYFYKQNQEDSAEFYFYKSKVLKEKIGDLVGIAMTLESIGVLKQRKANFNDASNIFHKVLNIYESNGILENMCNINCRLADLHLEMNNLDSALYYSIKSKKIAIKLAYPMLILNSSKLLSRSYDMLKVYDSAFYYYKMEIKMKDSLFNVSNKNAAFKQQTKYEYEKQKALDDKENEKRIAIEKEKQHRQFIVLIFSIVGSAIVVILLLIIYRRLQITKKQKVIIEETNEELNQTNDELARQKRIIEIQKNEVEEKHKITEKQKEIIEEKHKEITDSINYAKRIQNAILPSLESIKTALPQSFVYYQPKDVVAGDFYWFEQLDKGGAIYIAAADCTGHGVPGAMVSVVCSNALNKALLEEHITETGKLLDRVRELVIHQLGKGQTEVKDGMDISLCRINLTNNTLQYSGANNPLYIIRNNEVLITKADKQPIGVMEKAYPFTTNEVELQKNDCIYLFTDGYADQFGGAEGKKLGYKNFREKLLEISSLDMERQQEVLSSFFQQWKSNEEQIDDICIVGVRI